MSWSACLYLMNPDAVDLVIINLKVLAGLKETDRLITRNAAFEVQETGWMQTLSRKWNGDTRWSNFVEIKKLVDDALRILGAYCAHAFGPSSTVGGAAPIPKPDNAPESVRTLITELNGAAGGLSTLKLTYVGDPRMLANLDVLLQKLQCEVSRAQAALPTSPMHHTPPLPAEALPVGSQLPPGGPAAAGNAQRISHTHPPQSQTRRQQPAAAAD